MKTISTDKYAQVYDAGRRFTATINLDVYVPSSDNIDIDREKAREIVQGYIESREYPPEIPLDRVNITGIHTYGSDSAEPI